MEEGGYESLLKATKTLQTERREQESTASAVQASPRRLNEAQSAFRMLSSLCHLWLVTPAPRYSNSPWPFSFPRAPPPSPSPVYELLDEASPIGRFATYSLAPPLPPSPPPSNPPSSRGSPTPSPTFAPLPMSGFYPFYRSSSNGPGGNNDTASRDASSSS
ncbi:hypothetical protein PUNSTDRAFT_138638 [Punctularia strigosozonata HHB-11173 SS5]|uniref:Uncharacterized protein n=1 Tax=Punctularia strigosozonata (strain HHB-11173) TaxID=741275 RepID=R7S4S3_PUNST|nr:uncharacterized protein PUNSTDRAFT_138638 [Punctularia strigosozonata HHB-11173 SS5]EIN04246.1 hypothetical protein PUNSTDRAFT_138638 [Punctularia strigosozonata HHB-11173 SS5]